MKLMLLPLLLFTLMALASSCNQKEFDNLAAGSNCACELIVTYDHLWQIPTDDGPDWQKIWDDQDFCMTYASLLPSDPDGLRVLEYHADGKYDIYNLPAHGGLLELKKGPNSLLLYNNDTEYIIFNQLGNAAGAFASTRTKSRSGYVGSPFVNDEVNANTITPPDVLYACDGGDIVGSEEEVPVLHYELKPLVYKYLLRYHFTAGLHHVMMARGGMAGMAAGVYLADGHTSSEAGTLLFDMDAEDAFAIQDPETGLGLVYAVVNTFGVPDLPNDYYARAERTHALSLEVMLKNGATKNFDFDISEQVRLQPRGGVIDVYGLEIQEEEADTGKGSFDVDINNWDDFIEVPFM